MGIVPVLTSLGGNTEEHNSDSPLFRLNILICYSKQAWRSKTAPYACRTIKCLFDVILHRLSPGSMKMSSSDSYFYAAIVAVLAVHVVLALFVYVAWNEGAPKGKGKDD